MRAVFSGYATASIVAATICRLAGEKTQWEWLASGAIAALLAIAWRPVSQTQFHGLWTVRREGETQIIEPFAEKPDGR